MRKGWRTRTLDESCEFYNGLWKGEAPPLVSARVIRNTNFTKEGTLDYSDVARIDVEAKKLDKRRLRFGDILLEKSGGGPKQPVGRVALFDRTDEDYSFSNFTAALRVRDPGELDFRFLHQFLHWTYLSGATERMQSHSTGIRNLDGNAYKALTIPLPPIADQRRIVGALEQAFACIATARAGAESNLRNARSLFESHLEAVFERTDAGWTTLSLGELATFRNGINFTRSSHGHSTRIVGVKDFQNHYWAPLDDLETVITRNPLADSDLLREGDLLFVRSNGNQELIGRSLLVGPVGERITHSGFTIRARLDGDRVLPSYLCHHLKSGTSRRAMIDHGTGVNIKSLSQSTLSNLTVRFPSREAQARIVERLDAASHEVRALTAAYQRKIAALEELKKAVLHQAFGGPWEAA